MNTATVCRLLSVSRSGYYKHRERNDKKTLKGAVEKLFYKHKGNYGKRPIQAVLKRESGIKASLREISRILKEKGLVAKGGRKKRRNYPVPTKEEYTAENLVPNKYTARGFGEIYCADITEIQCKSGKVYVSGIIDVASRLVVAVNVRTSAKKEMILEGITEAIGRYGKCNIFHSDRGTQYTARQTKELLEENGIRQSMSRPGRPNDNQPIESFWKTLKREMDGLKELTFKEVKQEIFKYIETYYNTERLHSALGYITPAETRSNLSVN